MKIIHRSTWKWNSPKFVFCAFCELTLDGVLRSSSVNRAWGTQGPPRDACRNLLPAPGLAPAPRLPAPLRWAHHSGPPGPSLFCELRVYGVLRSALRKDLLQLYLLSREPFTQSQGRSLHFF